MLVLEILPYAFLLRVLLSGLLNKPEYTYNMDYTHPNLSDLAE